MGTPIWEGVEESDGQQRPYLAIGKYVVEYEGSRTFTSKKGKGEGFVTEFEVAKILSGDEGATPVGSGCVSVIMEESKFRLHLKDIKSLVAAVNGIPIKDVTGPLIGALMTEKGQAAAKGTKFVIDVTEGLTAAGKPRSNYAYSAHEEKTEPAE